MKLTSCFSFGAFVLMLACSSTEGGGGSDKSGCLTNADCPGDGICVSGGCVASDVAGVAWDGVQPFEDAAEEPPEVEGPDLRETWNPPEPAQDTQAPDSGEAALEIIEDVHDGEVAPEPLFEPGAEVSPEAVPEIVPETADESVEPPGYEPCDSLAGCELDALCNLSLGRCEPRGSWTAATPSLFSFSPPAGAPGDRLVIDGERFYATMLGSLAVSISIGSVSLGSFSGLQVDENRIVAAIPAGASGPIVVHTEDGLALSSATPLALTEAGALGCDGTSPAASGAPGSEPLAAGPHAAGYVDLAQATARLYYPAQCGSLRRPAMPGTWPLVVMLHGNGAVYLMYEYAAELLATWGFISVIPATDSNNDYSAEVVAQIAALVAELRGRPLDGIHDALIGAATTNELAWVGHSRGCARTQNTVDAHEELWNATVGTVFLGPHDDGTVVPGLFLVIGAGKDGQSFPGMTESAYDRQAAPRWKVWIPGANHGNFADHKVYYLFDGQPEITRHEQLGITASFLLPFMQRAFGASEAFAAQLDSPPPSPIYEVTHDP